MDPVFSIETIICITTFIVCFFHNIAKDFDTMGFQDLGCLHIYSHYSLKMIKSQHVALTHNICSLIFIHEKMVTKDRNPYSGNALVRVQRVRAQTRRSLGHHLLHPLILRLLVLCAPPVLRPRALKDAPAPADPNS